MNALEVKVVQLLLESVGPSVTEADIIGQNNLLSSGLVASLALLQFFVALQAECSVELDIADLTEENFGSVQSIVALLGSKGASVQL